MSITIPSLIHEPYYYDDSNLLEVVELRHSLEACFKSIDDLLVLHKNVEKITRQDDFKVSLECALSAFSVNEEYIQSFESMEKVKKFLEDLPSKLIMLLDKVIEYFKKLWKLLSSETGRLEFILERIKHRAKLVIGTSPSATVIKVSYEANKLMVNSTVPGNSSALVKSIVETKRQFDVFVSKYPTHIEKYGENILNVLKLEVDYGMKIEHIINCAKTFNLDGLSSELSTKAYKDSRFKQGEVVAALPILNNKTIFIRKNPLLDENETDKFKIASAYKNIGVAIMESTSEYHTVEETNFPTLNGQEITQICDILLNVIESINSYAKGPTISALEKISQDLKKQAMGLRTHTEAVENKDEKRMLNLLISYGTNFANLSVSPIDTFISLWFMVMRAFISVSNKSLTHLG